MNCLEEIFSINVRIGKPILVGQNEVVGRLQLIPILSGELIGKNISRDFQWIKLKISQIFFASKQLCFNMILFT